MPTTAPLTTHADSYVALADRKDPRPVNFGRSSPGHQYHAAPEGTPELRIQARIADLWRERDEARMAWLNHVIATTHRCRFCNSVLSDKNQVRLAGVCCRMQCRRKDNRERRAAGVLAAVAPEPGRGAAPLPGGLRALVVLRGPGPTTLALPAVPSRARKRTAKGTRQGPRR